jgi:TPR repeat protein
MDAHSKTIMQKLARTLLSALVTLLAVVNTAVAGPLEAASTRYDFTTALRLYRQLADQGIARTQSEPGAMYANGEGVMQNYVEAMKWQRKDADSARIAEEQKTGGPWKAKPNPNFPVFQAGAQTSPRPNSPPQGGLLAAPSVPMTPGAPITSKRREATSHGNASFVTRPLPMPRMKMAGFVSLDEVILKVREVAIEKLVGDAEGGNAEARNELGYAYWNGLVALPDRPRDHAEALRCRGAEAQQSGCAALRLARNVIAMGWWRKAADQSRARSATFS